MRFTGKALAIGIGIAALWGALSAVLEAVTPPWPGWLIVAYFIVSIIIGVAAARFASSRKFGR